MKSFGLLIICFCIVFSLTVKQALCEFPSKGIGLILGEPTGISGKLWMSTDTAISGAAAWSFVKNEHFHLHADWISHNWNILKKYTDITSGELPLYYGIGGRVKIEDDVRIGLKFVLGTAYIFEEAPFDIFFEIAPVMDIVPETELNSNAGIGVRYWF